MRSTDEVAPPEAVARRKNGIFGALLFVVGLTAAMVAMWAMESLAFATLWIAVAMVGGGFLAAGDLRGLLGISGSPNVRSKEDDQCDT